MKFKKWSNGISALKNIFKTHSINFTPLTHVFSKMFQWKTNIYYLLITDAGWCPYGCCTDTILSASGVI